MKEQSFLVSVQNVSGRLGVVVIDQATPKASMVTVSAEDMKGDSISFVVPPDEAPPINKLLRVTVEEVT